MNSNHSTPCAKGGARRGFGAPERKFAPPPRCAGKIGPHARLGPVSYQMVSAGVWILMPLAEVELSDTR
jgi:hypothetical protein